MKFETTKQINEEIDSLDKLLKDIPMEDSAARAKIYDRMIALEDKRDNRKTIRNVAIGVAGYVVFIGGLIFLGQHWYQDATQPHGKTFWLKRSPTFKEQWIMAERFVKEDISVEESLREFGLIK